MQETVKLILTKFTDETFAITASILVLVTVTLIAYWIYNRRRFHKLSHQIPASIVKNYLDSIIQNSQSLKSSLFRGGGADLGSVIPSVMPLNDLAQSSIALRSTEEVNQKNAEISSLNSRLLEKDRLIKDLEKEMSSKGGGDPLEAKKLKDQIVVLEKQIKSLEEQLAAAKASSGSGDVASSAKLQEVTKERDDLKEKLQEYEIIEEDLANLKRLQQENEQLRKSLGGAAPVAAAPVAAAPAPVAKAAPAPEPVVEAEPVAAPADDFEAQMAAAISAPAPSPDEDLEAQMAAAIAESKKPAAAASAPAAAEPEIPANEGEQKSADQLLSEFEKMLG